VSAPDDVRDDARGDVVAIVPLRDGVSGKSRLATALDPAARRRLVAALARHVVEVLGSSPRVGRVVVVTADVPFARETLAGLVGHVTVVEQPADRLGLNVAIDVGREHLLRSGSGAARLLVVHADLPALTPSDVEAVLGTDADVVVATDRHDAGTNLLLVPGTAAYRFRFGEGSRTAHVAEAERLGLRFAVVRRPGTTADLDTIDDWAELPGDVRTRVRTAVGHPLP
jgi:2-phospho-L-lactate guanylyltransferase